MSLGRETRLSIWRRPNIRFFDSQSAIVWNELSTEEPFNLLPVRGMKADRLKCELSTLERFYTCTAPYVFLHVSVAESETDGVVVWAVRRSGNWALLHAVASLPVADTIAAIALSLPVRSVFFVWDPQLLSLAKHYLLRWFGVRLAIPLDTMWLIGRSATGKEPPKVLIRRSPDCQYSRGSQKRSSDD